ncbi:MAG: DHA2 family efflux MFS transporter permease subunit [Candidatus Tectomicrobia bacterium]
MQQATAVTRAPAGKWVIAGTVVLGSFVSVMDFSIVNVAMPEMVSTFGVSIDAITWVAVSYSIAEIILATMAAWFSRLLGRKRFFVLSFILFTAASMLCGAARSIEMMILARILQGIGGGGLIPVSQAITLETFPENERGMAMALYSMGVAVAPAVGPVLGGWLTDTYGWPWIFYINLPLGVLGICMSILVLTDPPYMQRQRTRIDVTGIILLAVGLTALQLFLERGEREQWFESSFIVVTAVVALVTLTALVVWELYAEEPVINFRLLKNVPFTAGLCLGAIFGFTLFGSFFVLALFLQRLQGHSVMNSGLFQMPRMLIVILVTPLAGRLYNVIDNRLLIGCGLALMMLGYLDMAGFTLEVGLPQMLPSFLLTGAGMAFMFGPMSAIVMRTVPLPLLTAAASLSTLWRRIGGNAGYAFVAMQIERRSAFHRARLVDHVTPYDVNTTRVLDGLTGRLAAGGGLPPGIAENSALKLLDNMVTRQATMLAYNDIFWLMGMVFVLGVPFLLLLGGRGQRTAAKQA